MIIDQTYNPHGEVRFPDPEPDTGGGPTPPNAQLCPACRGRRILLFEKMAFVHWMKFTFLVAERCLVCAGSGWCTLEIMTTFHRSFDQQREAT
mgnify:CR=1 FL=1